MADPQHEESARAWMVSGNHDLRSAKALLALEPPETETTAFHAQQAAEKYLKALLVFHGEEPPRTHDLIVLLDLVLRYDPRMESFRDESRLLVPFAVQVRYPFTGPPPTPEEAADAFASAQRIYQVVREVINH